MKIYILQKDLPDGSKVGDEYIYIEGSDSVYKNNSDEHKMKLPYFAVENNPDWFKLKEEEKPYADFLHRNSDSIVFREYPAGCEYIITKERLYELLLAESKGELRLVSNFLWEKFNDVKYTEKELLEAEGKAFMAAREKDRSMRPVYHSFQDYKNVNVYE